MQYCMSMIQINIYLFIFNLLTYLLTYSREQRAKEAANKENQQNNKVCFNDNEILGKMNVKFK